MPVKRPLLSVPYLFNYTPFTLFGTRDDPAPERAGELDKMCRERLGSMDRLSYHYSYLGGISYTLRDAKTSLSSVILTGRINSPDTPPRTRRFSRRAW